MVRSSQLSQKATYASLIREERLPEPAEGSFLDVVLMPRRPLAPTRLAREVTNMIPMIGALNT
jgi:hypothetical protein